MNIKDVLKRLKQLSNPKAVKGMARFGITPDQAYGVAISNLRKIATDIGPNHELALQLWKYDTRETRILASMIAIPDSVTEELIDEWTKIFTYWEICDQCIANLFEKIEYAYDKAVEYHTSEDEFIKRTGFVLMARLAVSDKKAPDEKFIKFLSLIKKCSTDNRTFVKKGVNWALRQIGKRNKTLHKKALAVAREIRKMDNPAAKWIAADAIRELTDEKIISKIKK